MDFVHVFIVCTAGIVVMGLRIRNRKRRAVVDDTDLAILAAFVVYGVCNKEWEPPVLLGMALLLCLGAAWAAGAFERFAQKRRKQQSR